MYKNHIRKWNIQKNLSEKDARTILRETRRRHAFGKRTLCVIGGKTVSVERAKRYFRKKNIDINHPGFDDLTNDVNDHFGPSNVRCSTPPVTAFTTAKLQIPKRPTDLPEPESLQQLLANVDICVEEFWTSALINDADREAIKEGLKLRIGKADAWRHAFEQILTPGDLLPYLDAIIFGKRKILSKQAISKAFEQLDQLIVSDGLSILDELVHVYRWLITDCSQRVFWYVLKYLGQLAAARLPISHPFRIIMGNCVKNRQSIRHLFDRIGAVSETRRRQVLGARNYPRPPSKSGIVYNPNNWPIDKLKEHLFRRLGNIDYDRTTDIPLWQATRDNTNWCPELKLCTCKRVHGCGKHLVTPLGMHAKAHVLEQLHELSGGKWIRPIRKPVPSRSMFRAKPNFNQLDIERL